ncbi:DUF4439 domain-containing protein [Jatrophihabitans endophyticus]|uniref:DUF4439 domain-containing protein n=1 Tax=Jatrophihabitans endophyticus TaxID=1206085 RepID=UPI001A0CCEB1|nr:DUF4439 domain-containing protein [Jatrophihabitans endophyticus]MBE7187779.1 DUF4439 domain-containing protein [Jatrophihabitans endophyticus]
MSALITAWQAALAGEHQAAFGYSLLGPRLTGRALALAIACSNAHEALRDRTEQALVAAGQSPVQSRADYPALYPVRTADAARALAIRLEDDCAAGWRHLYAVAAGMAADAQVTVVRHDAQSALTASAVRATRWRLVSGEARATVAFPGV